MNAQLHTLCSFSVVGLTLLNACGGGGGDGNGNFTPPPGTVQFVETSYDIAEGARVDILVARSGGMGGVVNVDYATGDGTATGGSDYTATNGTLTWPDGVSGNQTITIPTTDDDTVEQEESFTVTLSNVSVAALGENSSATVNIIDNDDAVAIVDFASPAAEPFFAFGVITALDSVTVNGVHYETNATNVTINGVLASVSDLELGQIVVLEGDMNLGAATGTASDIAYNATVIGPVQGIDAAPGRLFVMGQTVLINADTVFDPRIDPGSLAGLTVGSNAQVSGFLNADGEIVATRIEPATAGARFQIVGSVAGLDLANMLFRLNRLIVDYGTAVLIELPYGMPTDGMFVIARGSLTNGILVVEEIESLYNSTDGTPASSRRKPAFLQPLRS